MCAQQRIQTQPQPALRESACHPGWYFYEVRPGIFVCPHPSHQRAACEDAATKQKAFAQRHPRFSGWLSAHRQVETVPPAPAPQRLPQWQRQAIIAECQHRRQNTGPIPAQTSVRTPARPGWLNTLVENEQARTQELPDGPRRTSTGALFLNAHVNQEDRQRMEHMIARAALEKAPTTETLPESDIDLFVDDPDDTQVIKAIRRR